MAKISEIMLLQQPEQPALAIEVQTYMKGMSGYRREFCKNRLFIQETGRSNHGYPLRRVPRLRKPDRRSYKNDYRTEIFETFTR